MLFTKAEKLPGEGQMLFTNGKKPGSERVIPLSGTGKGWHGEVMYCPGAVRVPAGKGKGCAGQDEDRVCRECRVMIHHDPYRRTKSSGECSFKCDGTVPLLYVGKMELL